MATSIADQLGRYNGYTVPFFTGAEFAELHYQYHSYHRSVFRDISTHYYTHGSISNYP